jgi:hypothetical protein
MAIGLIFWRFGIFQHLFRQSVAWFDIRPSEQYLPVRSGGPSGPQNGLAESTILRCRHDTRYGLNASFWSDTIHLAVLPRDATKHPRLDRLGVRYGHSPANVVSPLHSIMDDDSRVCGATKCRPANMGKMNQYQTTVDFGVN